MSVEQRYRYLYKPGVFITSLVPAALLVAGALGWFGQDLGADPVARLLHTCGKTGLNFLLLTLLVTPVRRLTGWTHLVRLRRMLGLFAFFYLVAHFTVYLVLDRQLDYQNVLQDIVKRPYITIGFAALLMLIPLAVTSTNRMMRRLGRRWQKLHRLIYVIAILGVWHYWWQVKKDIRQPLLYVGMLAVLLGFRLVVRALNRARAAAPTTAVTSTSAPATAPEKT
ncbi:MAG TPA: protein-methionine-sulfoxide reductase heme-binding subunit MsrQ [Steroidobacteraceae bacterium]|jgi:sulfoxide reductase heme-binding subunit YedZ|nr:protein-methionine-sulfoxide reductase heme-binding subunit MsrQ [Steroidobacteraceae bacterium]